MAVILLQVSGLAVGWPGWLWALYYGGQMFSHNMEHIWHWCCGEGHGVGSKNYIKRHQIGKLLIQRLLEIVKSCSYRNILDVINLFK